MPNVEQLKSEIQKLPPEKIAELTRWLTELDWELWDRRIEADANSGKLDFLIHEALEEKAKGRLMEL
jgi:hypothetical protein